MQEQERRTLEQIRRQYQVLLERAINDNRTQLLALTRQSPQGVEFNLQITARPRQQSPQTESSQKAAATS